MKKPSTFKMKNPALAKFVKRAGSPMRVDEETLAYRKKRKEERERKHKELNRKLAALDKDDPNYKKKRRDIIARSEGRKANKKDKEGLTKKQFVEKEKKKNKTLQDFVKSKGGYAGLNMKKDEKGVYRNPEGYSVKELYNMSKKS